MLIRDLFIPRFLGRTAEPRDHKVLLNYRRARILAVGMTALFSLAPLFSMAVFDYQISSSAAESEVRLQTARTVSNAKRAVSFYLVERLSALRFVLGDNTPYELQTSSRLAELLENLKESHGGFVDLGLIDQFGRQQAYAGQYNMEGRNY